MNIDTLYPSLKPLTHKYGEDIVQITILKIWANQRHIFDLPHEEFIAYITTCCEMVCIDQLRKYGREQLAINEAYSSHDTYMNPELVSLLRSELSKAEGKSNRTYRRCRHKARKALI